MLLFENRAFIIIIIHQTINMIIIHQTLKQFLEALFNLFLLFHSIFYLFILLISTKY